MPLDYTIPSKTVAANLFAELQDLMITEEELGDGSKDAVFNTIENTPIGGTTAAAGTFTDLTFTGISGLSTSDPVTIDGTGTQFGLDYDTNDFELISSSLTIKDGGIDHDSTANFLTNEHIDWTNSANNFSTSGTLACGGITLTGGLDMTGDIECGGSLFSSSGTFNFNDDSLITTGPINGGAASFTTLAMTGNITISGPSTVIDMNDHEIHNICTLKAVAGNDLSIYGYDDLALFAADKIDIIPSGDTDYYFRLTTVSNIPTIATVGSCDLKITSSSGAIDFDNETLTTTTTIQAEQLTSTDDITMQGHLLTMGDAGVATDTILRFLGSNNSIDITYDESAAKFDFGFGTIEATFLNSTSLSNCVIADTCLFDSLISRTDSQHKIVLDPAADTMTFYSGDAAADNHIVFKSTDDTAVSPQIYPNANNEGQIGIAGQVWNIVRAGTFDDGTFSVTGGTMSGIADLGTVTTADIDGGTIDGVALGSTCTFGDIVSVTDAQHKIVLYGAADAIYMYPGDISGDNYIKFWSADATADSPAIFPSSNGEGRIGWSGAYWGKSYINNMFLGNDMTIADGGNIILNTTNGTQIATAADQKLGYFGATPVVQQAHIVDAANAAGDPPTQAEFNAFVAKFNTLLSYLDADAGLGLLAGA